MPRLSADEIFAADFVTEPIWWSDIAPQRAALRPLPARVDVAVVGSGYCGLSAALELARAGLRVAVFDTGALGQGASSRNGGMIGGAVKLGWSELAAKYGERTAAALLDGARASFEHLEDLIARESIDAEYRRSGTLTLACNPAQFRGIAAAGPGARRAGARGPDRAS